MNDVVEEPVVEPKEKTPDDMRVSSEEVSTDLPLIQERSQGPDTSKPGGRHTVFVLHIFLKILTVKSVSSLRAGTARKHKEIKSGKSSSAVSTQAQGKQTLRWNQQ